MYIAKHNISFSNSTATTESSASESNICGLIYAIGSTGSPEIPSSNQLTVYAETTGRPILELATLSADPWIFYPRTFVCDSTMSTTGNSTEGNQFPCMHSISDTEFVKAIVVGSATSGSSVDFFVHVMGR